MELLQIPWKLLKMQVLKVSALREELPWRAGVQRAPHAGSLQQQEERPL